MITYRPPTVEEARDAWQAVVDDLEQHANEAHAGDVTNDPDCERCTELDGDFDVTSLALQEAVLRSEAEYGPRMQLGPKWAGLLP